MPVDGIRTGKVQHLEIFQIPPDFVTRTRITPDALEKEFFYRLTIRDLQNTTYRRSLMEVLASVSATARTEIPDLRWGVVFFDETERRIGSLYFDAVGNSGTIDSMPVEFSGGMPKWLRGSFLLVFE
jgi:hypothetical protein